MTPPPAAVMPPYGSTTRGPQRTRNSVACGSPSGGLGEEQPGVAGRGERVPHVAIRRLGPDEEAGPVRGLAVDPVELAEPVAVGVDDRDARRSGPC